MSAIPDTKILCRDGFVPPRQGDVGHKCQHLAVGPTCHRHVGNFPSQVTYGKWITNTCLKSVWEKVDKFNIKIKIAPLPMSPPRKGDKWFMQVAREAGVTDPRELVMLNRFRCHQQVLFLSNVLDAGGQRLDIKYLNRHQDHEVWSTLMFPLEKPPR
jgi:hypothetical protein